MGNMETWPKYFQIALVCQVLSETKCQPCTGPSILEFKQFLGPLQSRFNFVVVVYTDKVGNNAGATVLAISFQQFVLSFALSLTT